MDRTCPLCGVPPRRNPKGIGLFAHACFDLAAALRNGIVRSSSCSEDTCRGEAGRLLSWLAGRGSAEAPGSDDLRGAFGHAAADSGPTVERLAGLGWGYHYPWQDVGFFQPRHYPNRVVTSWIGFAFLRGWEETRQERFLKAGREIAEFLLRNPKPLMDSPSELCLSYVPSKDIHWAVMDVSALTAAFCTRLAALTGAPIGEDGEPARLMRFVVNRQTDYGAWFYTWPSKDSHIKHDNYHTGIILDCLADYMADSDNDEYIPHYVKGLDFYRQHLFLDNGAPRWMNDRTYPHDVHGAAAGVLAFNRAAVFAESSTSDKLRRRAPDYRAFADRILDWTLENLYSGKGAFYYRKGRFATNRLCLMRWCNAWMCRAIAGRLRSQSSRPAAISA